MSSEAAFAERMARRYGRRGVQLTRTVRVRLLEHLIERNRTEYERTTVPANGFDEFIISPRQRELLDDLAFLRAMIEAELRDLEYAREARHFGVEYREHVDGFCRYWQNLRFRKFVAADWQCESCREKTSQLDCHHLHYRTLGYEELSDVQALCRKCHEDADKIRKWSAAFETYVSKKYGDDWEDAHGARLEEIEDEFSEWLESREAP